MSKERELLKKVLEAPNNENRFYLGNILIKNIKKLLAQPEPKPNMIVGYWNGYPDTYLLAADEYNRYKDNENYDAIRPYVYPLYSAPSKREPLSDEELSTLATDDLYDCTYTTSIFAYKEYARKIEKAHGIGEL
jgi:hypothetical protein